MLQHELPRQQNVKKRWSMPSMPYKYPFNRCNLHFGLPAARRCHKCAGLFDIAYWCVLYLRAQMQHTSEISTHIVRAHNMPCHHHQDTHQQEIHHQKYHSNATATPEKYLANIAKHSIKNIPADGKPRERFDCLLPGESQWPVIYNIKCSSELFG